MFFRPWPHPQGTMWGGGGLVASWCIFILITTLLDNGNTATTKKLDFTNSNLTSVRARVYQLLFYHSGYKLGFGLTGNNSTSIVGRQHWIKWAEYQMTSKCFYLFYVIENWFLIATEPTRLEEVQSDVCAEHEQWKIAMYDKTTYMGLQA
jgi:hypothetical protein